MPHLAHRLALAGFAALNLVVGFLAQWWPAVQLGVGADTDALYASLVLPQLLNAVVSGGISSVLTPLLVTADRDAFHARAWASFVFVAAIGLATTVPLALTASWWAPRLFPGFAAGVSPTLVSLVRLQLLSSFFTILLAANWATYWARHRFVWVEVSGALAGVAALAAMALALPRYGVMAAGVAFTVRTGLHVLLLLPGLGPFRAAAGVRAIYWTLTRRLLPLAAGSLVHRADPLVERVLASMAPAGQLSLLHLGQQLFNGANQVITKTFANPLMTRLTEHVQHGDWPAFRRALRSHLLLVTTLTLAGAFAVTAAGHLALGWLGTWGRLEPADLNRLYWLLVALSGIFVGGAGGQVLVTGFFALGDTSTPTRAGVAGFIAAVLAKLAVFPRFGVMGLAVVASVHSVVMIGVHLVLLRRVVARRRQAGFRIGASPAGVA